MIIKHCSGLAGTLKCLLSCVILLSALIACGNPAPQATQPTVAAATEIPPPAVSTSSPSTSTPAPTATNVPTLVPTTALPPTILSATQTLAMTTAVPSNTSLPTATAATSANVIPSTTTESNPTTAPEATVAVASTTTVADVPAQPLPEIALARSDSLVLLRDNGSEELITRFPTDALSVFGSANATWSPDGYRLAGGGAVWTFSADPGVASKRSPLIGTTFRWSPSGRRLAFFVGLPGLDALGVAVGGADGADPKLVDQRGGAITNVVLEWDINATLAEERDEVIDPRPPRDPNVPVSPDGNRYALARPQARDDLTQPVRLEVGYREGDREVIVATIPLTGTDEEIQMYEQVLGINPPRLRWLPDGSGLLVPLNNSDLDTSSQGTWLARLDGTVTHISPYILIDLQADGQRMLAQTPYSEQVPEVVVVRIADGVVERSLGRAWDAAFRPKLFGPAPSAPLAERSPTLSLQSPGLEGPAVRELQTLLKDLGFLSAEVDSIFGPATDEAVRGFQERSREDLGAPDGIMGPRSWAELRYRAMVQASGYDPYLEYQEGGE